MKKYVFIICLLLCLTGCTTHVNLNTPEQTQENATQDNTTQNNTTLIDNELLEYSDDKISWKLEYPVLNSESSHLGKKMPT